MGDAAEGPESRVPLVALRDAFAAYVQVNHIIQCEVFHTQTSLYVLHEHYP